MSTLIPPFMSFGNHGQPTSAASPETTPPDPLAALRRTRHHDHLAAALQTPNPLRAVIGAEMNNLLELADAYQAALTPQVLSLASLDGLREVRPAIDTLLRLQRQIDRFAQFEERASQAEQAAARAATTPAGAAASEENAS